MNNIWGILLLQVVLIALNAVFACAEIAVISINDGKLSKLADEGNKNAKKLLTLKSNPASFLATIQVAITLSGFLGSAFAADNFSGMIVTFLVSLGVTIPVGILDTIAVVLITFILSYFTLVFGELVPKRVAMRKAETLALKMATFISIIATIFAPLVFLLTASTNGVLRLLGINPHAKDENLSEEDIQIMIEEGNKNGVVDEEEKTFIQNIFEFDDLTASEICTHRVDVEILWLEDMLTTWKDSIKQSKHRFFPVCEDSQDKIIGVLDSKEYLKLDKFTKSNITSCIKQPKFIPENIKADVLFKDMKKENTNFAIIVDEHGGMEGIVTMHDLIEELVGDYDMGSSPTSSKTEIKKMEKNGNIFWKIKGNVLIADVEKNLKIDLSDNDSDTFSGYILSTIGNIPKDGETMSLDVKNLHIEILKIKNHKIIESVVSFIDSKDDITKKHD